jgi:hypothetical protein
LKNKNWLTDYRKNGIPVSTKMILIEARKLAIEMPVTDFAGTTSCVKDLREKMACVFVLKLQ